MKVIAGADDVSPALDAVLEHLRGQRIEIEILPQDQWPVVARKVGESVAAGAADFGLLMCWTGTGTSMMANKVPGVRAALCWDPWIAEGARRWNDANVLVMSLKRTSPEQAIEIVKAWLSVDRPDPDEQVNIDALNHYDKSR